MTFNDIVEEIKTMCRNVADAKNATERHNRRVRRDKAIQAVRKMAPNRRPTKTELAEYRRSCLCAHDRDNPPMHWPAMEATVDDSVIRHIARGLYNNA
tara:strand:- start:11448 stop:11741 length:294 start_codon:yes stop_codon:yes gene_type:complete